MQPGGQGTKPRIFGGRYQIGERIGTGGMSEVYRGFDLLLERAVAVKVLNRRLSSDERFVARFRREAQIAARLNHPNVVALHDYGVDGDDYFIVMELIEGTTVAEVIDKKGPLEPRRAARVAVDVARALHRAHEAGLVHRDVTPGNVMITTTGHTKVTDFGIARVLASDDEATTSRLGAVMGTAAYLSPEQAQGLTVDPRSDVYSLGVVLYEMLTGTVPFQADTPLATASKHVSEPAPPPSTLVPIPEDLDAIVLRALAKNPGARFTDAVEMEADLTRFLTGRALRTTLVIEDGIVVARPADRWPYTSKPEAASGAARRVLATVLIAALAAAGGFLWARSIANDAIPNLEGRLVSDARARLVELGLSARLEERHGDAPAGIVVRQSPRAGTEMDAGETVILVVSKGPAPPPPPEPSTFERLTDDVETIFRGLDDFLGL